MQNKKRQEIIDTALTLFNQHGFHNTGVNLIMETAGISKKTLYAYFRSKEDLIAACLQQADSLSRSKFMHDVDASSNDPHEKLMAAFDVTQDWFTQKDYFGCIFINAIAEYSSNDTAIRAICQQSKKLKGDYLKSLCVEAGLKEPEKLAEELCLLIEGATVTAQVSQNQDAAVTAKNIAEQLIRIHQ